MSYDKIVRNISIVVFFVGMKMFISPTDTIYMVIGTLAGVAGFYYAVYLISHME